jgi:ABC-type bacteriocin/lantibiotic exporter with double-glycine peptidase domain
MQSGALGRFLRLPMRLYPETPSGQVSSAAIQYMDGSWFLRDSLHLIHCLFCTGILAWIIARFSLLLAVVSTLPMLLIGIAIQLIQSRWVKTQTKEMEARSRFESFITDTLHGILTVKLFSTESFHTAHFRRLVQEHNWRWLQVGFLLEGAGTQLALAASRVSSRGVQYPVNWHWALDHSHLSGIRRLPDIRGDDDCAPANFTLCSL